MGEAGCIQQSGVRSRADLSGPACRSRIDGKVYAGSKTLADDELSCL